MRQAIEKLASLKYTSGNSNLCGRVGRIIVPLIFPVQSPRNPLMTAIALVHLLTLFTCTLTCSLMWGSKVV